MVGPGDEGAGRYSSLRASHADRERVIGVLKTAFVQGRLAKDEFDLRVSRVLASRTYAELNALTADMPPGLVSAQPPEPARKSERRAGPGIDGEEDRQVVGRGHRGAAEPGGRCGPAGIRNPSRVRGHCRGHVRVRGSRAGQRAGDAARLD